MPEPVTPAIASSLLNGRDRLREPASRTMKGRSIAEQNN
jgi:hypothetical protein